MEITLWGTRGSLPSSGPETQIFGGNTTCVSIEAEDRLIVLDAGSGIRRLGMSLNDTPRRIDLFLTHLHMDHIQGLGFFTPLYKKDYEIHIWGPASYNQSLPARLTRYLSPPLFPVRIRDLPCDLRFHEMACSHFDLGPFTISACPICHPGPTVGFRIQHGDAVFAFLPDHEPALGSGDLPDSGKWVSGFDLAREADVLVHDAQFTTEEYNARVGWGHSSIAHALRFAELTAVKRLLLFHHDPAHTDEQLMTMLYEQTCGQTFPFQIGLAKEGDRFSLPA